MKPAYILQYFLPIKSICIDGGKGGRQTVIHYRCGPGHRALFYKKKPHAWSAGSNIARIDPVVFQPRNSCFANEIVRKTGYMITMNAPGRHCSSNVGLCPRIEYIHFCGLNNPLNSGGG